MDFVWSNSLRELKPGRFYEHPLLLSNTLLGDLKMAKATRSLGKEYFLHFVGLVVFLPSILLVLALTVTVPASAISQSLTGTLVASVPDRSSGSATIYSAFPISDSTACRLSPIPCRYFTASAGPMAAVQTASSNLQVDCSTALPVMVAT